MGNEKWEKGNFYILYKLIVYVILLENLQEGVWLCFQADLVVLTAQHYT